MMKTMILAMLMLAITTTSHADQAALTAQEGFGTGTPGSAVVTCDFLEKTQKHEIKVLSGTSVFMDAASNPGSSGYRWVSKDGLPSEYTPGNPVIPGAQGIQSFELPLTSKMNKFTFKYTLGASRVVSTCVVIVKVQ